MPPLTPPEIEAPDLTHRRPGDVLHKALVFRVHPVSLQSRFILEVHHQRNGIPLARGVNIPSHSQIHHPWESDQFSAGLVYQAAFIRLGSSRLHLVEDDVANHMQLEAHRIWTLVAGDPNVSLLEAILQGLLVVSEEIVRLN